MPELPAFLADRLEPWFARRGRVTRVDRLAPSLRRIRIEGRALQRARWRPGQEVELRVAPSSFRHYTPALYDGRRGVFELVCFDHGEAPGTSWVRGLDIGTSINLLGPGGRFAINTSATTHVFLGDETCLGLFEAMARSLPKEARVQGAVEVARGNEAFPALVGLPFGAVTRDRMERGRALVAWARRNLEAGEEHVAVYLAGHAASILALRRVLGAELAIPSGSIRTRPYWADGRRGL